LDETCSDVLRCLGLSHVLNQAPDPVTALGINDAGVRRIANPLDFRCNDIPGLLRAIGGMLRRGVLPERFSDTGLQWTLSDWYRVQLYDKAAQILQDKRFDRTSRKRLAAEAAGWVRLEITLGSPLRLRKLFNLPANTLPTLGLMARPEVAAHVFRTEVYDSLHVDRLHVQEVLDLDSLWVDLRNVASEPSLKDHERLLRLAGAVVASWAAQYDQHPGAENHKGGVRAQHIVTTLLEAGGMGDGPIGNVLGLKPARRAQRRRELSRLGFVGNPDLYARTLVKGLLDAFRAQCPDDALVWSLDAGLLKELVVPAPWASDDEFDLRDDGSTVAGDDDNDELRDLLALYANDVDFDEDVSAA
jgi:hypothetical protein